MPTLAVVVPVVWEAPRAHAMADHGRPPIRRLSFHLPNIEWGWTQWDACGLVRGERAGSAGFSSGSCGRARTDLKGDLAGRAGRSWAIRFRCSGSIEPADLSRYAPVHARVTQGGRTPIAPHASPPEIGERRATLTGAQRLQPAKPIQFISRMRLGRQRSTGHVIACADPKSGLRPGDEVVDAVYDAAAYLWVSTPGAVYGRAGFADIVWAFPWLDEGNLTARSTSARCSLPHTHSGINAAASVSPNGVIV